MIIRRSAHRHISSVVAAALLAVLTSACTSDSDKSDQPAVAAVQVGPENIVKVMSDTIVVGPILSGELRPEREATVRAQLGGSMVSVNVDEGEPVRQGALLGRIEVRALQDARRSAQSAVQSAENQVAVAEREAQRSQQLVDAGALAQRDLDLARQSVTTAQAQLADARARLVTAEKQLGDAVIRSPLSGIVSKRAVNAGDVVSPGTELFTVIDPSSMRLEASVPSENLSQLRVGAAVKFTVRGYDQPFEGRIDRIAPAADPNTRQVPIFVSVPNTARRLVAGLFAEGRVVSQTATGLVVPSNAVNTSTDMPWVLRVAGGRTDRVPVTLGLRDPRTERVQITAGVNDGDVLLRGAAQGITPGTPVNVAVTQ